VISLEPGSRILVIRSGALGDTIVSLPAIRALRLAIGPSGRIELVGNQTWLRLALNSLHGNAIHSIDRARFVGLFSEPVGAELEAFLAGFDLVVAWCRDEGGHLARLAERLEGVAWLQSNPFSDVDSASHASEYLLQTLKPVGIGGAATLPELVLSPETDAVCRAFLKETKVRDGNFLAIHPGSGAPRKNWPPERFSRLAHLARESGMDILLVEGEADHQAVQALRRSMSWQAPLALNLDLEVLAAVLSRAQAFVGNDSGVTHLAAAAGAPTLAIFGSTDPRIWAPRGPRVEIIPQVAESGQAWDSIRKLSKW
jgi:ADP-heptose:LPS heptosyltransferase